MADDIAALGFSVDSSQALAGAAALDKLSASGKTAEAQANKVSQSHTLASTATKRLATEAQQAIVPLRAGAGVMSDIGGANDRVYASLSTRSFFRLLAREASLAGGPMAQIIQHFGVLGVGGQRLGIAVTGTTIAIAATVAVLYKAVEAFAAFELHQANVANALALTKSASGQTSDSLEALAKQFAANGTQSITDIRAVELELLKYKAVGGDAFATVLQIAKDTAATGFASMKEAATAVAKALKDPANASAELEAAGLKLSVAEQRLATDLYNAGKAAQAKQVILKSLSTQVTGADAKAADTLDAAWNRVGHSTLTVLEQWGKQIAEGVHLKEVLNGIASAADNVSKDREEPSTLMTILRLANPVAVARGLLAPTGLTTPVTLPPPAPKAPGDTFASRFDTAAIDKSSASYKQNEAELAALKKRLDEVNDALTVQLRTAGMSAVQQQAYNEAVKAGVVGDNAAEAAIRGKVNAIAAANETRQVTDQIKAQTAAQLIETQTLTMAAGPAAEYKAVQEALAQARIKNITLSTDEIAKIEKEAAALGKATQAANNFRGLKELARDAGDLNKQLDTFGVQSVNDFNNALLDYETGVKTGADATKAFEQQFVRSLLNMVNQMLIMKPLADALRMSLSGISSYFGGGPISLSSGSDGGSPGGLPVQAHTGGILGGDSFPGRYVHPAYFDDAPRFGSGGIVGGERPVVAHDGEGIFTPGQMKAMGSPRVSINVINNGEPANASIGQAKPDGAGGLSIDVVLDRVQAKNMTTPGSQSSRALAASGVRPSLSGVTQ